MGFNYFDSCSQLALKVLCETVFAETVVAIVVVNPFRGFLVARRADCRLGLLLNFVVKQLKEEVKIACESVDCLLNHPPIVKK
jgi:hypothetical protein